MKAVATTQWKPPRSVGSISDHSNNFPAGGGAAITSSSISRSSRGSNNNASIEGRRIRRRSTTGATRDEKKAASFLQYLDDTPTTGTSHSALPSSNSATNHGNNRHDDIITTTSDIQPLPEAQQPIQLGPGAHPIMGEGSVRPDHDDTVEDEEQSTVGMGWGGGQQQQQRGEQPPLPAVGNPSTSYDDSECVEDLVEALPVSNSFYFFQRSSRRLIAQPVHQGHLSERSTTANTDHHRQQKIQICCCCTVILVASLVVLALSLGFGLRNNNNNNNNNKHEEISVIGTDTTTAAEIPPTTSSPVPPMDNLELLYYNLPEKTKESLNYNDSIQYNAWEWLLDHPNVTMYPEWRKQQIFALSTFFLAMEGSNWPATTPGYNRWMDYNAKSECEWVMTQEEVAFFAAEGMKVLGRSAYEWHQDPWQPCNQDTGELQTIILHQVYLPSYAKPYIPPEIELLTSLKILGIAISNIPAKLSDLLAPELLRLPNMEGINFQNSGVGGTIPTEISLLTKLRHFPIGANKLTGTIPTQIGTMSSLEFLSVSQMDGMTGSLPTELGLVTSLTALFTYGSSLTGQLPSELGLLTNAVQLELWNNGFTGSIPLEMGLLTNLRDLRLGNDMGMQGFYNNNDFSGVLPTGLWVLSHAETLFLSNLPNLHGRVPPQDAVNMSDLISLQIDGCPHLSGTIPETLCGVDELSMDCSTFLCGCYCPCIRNNVDQIDP